MIKGGWGFVVWFLCVLLAYVPIAYVGGRGGQRGYQLSWNRSYRQLWAPMCMLEIEPGSSARAKSIVNHWANPPHPGEVFLKPWDMRVFVIEVEGGGDYTEGRCEEVTEVWPRSRVDIGQIKGTSEGNGLRKSDLQSQKTGRERVVKDRVGRDHVWKLLISVK